ncbi:MAG: SPASM domain-containing protein [Phycisphaerales bacterium]|nr:SPASM domain-containing protein [Phycisphaerales bacterium]
MPTTLAVIHADLERTPLGTRSRLGVELDGGPILRLTVERVCRAKRPAGCVVLVPQEQAPRCEAMLQGLPATVQRVNAPPVGWSQLVQVARKWSLGGWRGGLGGTTSLDEYFHPSLVAGALELHPADRVMVFPPAAPLLDPALIDAMIQHHDKGEDDARMTFAQAPPGAAGAIYNVDLLRELVGKGIPPGWIFSFKPDAPRRDMALFACCFDVRAPLRHGARRLIADTDRALETVSALRRQARTGDAAELGRLLRDYEASHVPPLPDEVEVELTTEDPFPEAVLRPRGARVGSRGPISLALIRTLAETLGKSDDSLVVLGGFGEPLRHPRFAEVLKTLRDGGVYGIAVRTSGVDLTDEAMEAMVTARVDALTVQIDGWTAETWRAMHGPAAPAHGSTRAGEASTSEGASLEAVRAGIDRLEQLKQARRCVAPIVVPEMVKARPTVGEMPEFFSGWIRALGTANIVGHTHRAGQLEPLAVMSMAPPRRTPCRRLWTRCMVLADGRVAACDQDFRGLQPIGDLRQMGLDEIWNGQVMTQLRAAHAEGRFGPVNPLCAACDDWHRP